MPIWCYWKHVSNQPDCFGIQPVLSFIRETQNSLSLGIYFSICCLLSGLLFLHPSLSFFLPLFLHFVPCLSICPHFLLSFLPAHMHIHIYSIFYHAPPHFSAEKSLRSALNHWLIFQGKLLTVRLGHTRDSQRGFKLNPIVMFCSQLHV